MTALPPVFVELRAVTGEFMAKLGEAQAEIDHLTRRGASGFDRLATAGRGALVGITGAALAIGGIAVTAALKGEQAHAALAQAVHNVGENMDLVDPKVEALTNQFAKLGFTHDELEQGLAVLTTSLRSTDKAFQNVGLAADLARYKHIGLADASLVVSKALEGQLRPLHMLGIDLPVAAGGALKMQQAQDALAKAQDNYNQRLAEYNAAHGPRAIGAAKTLEAAIVRLQAAHERLSKVQVSAQQIQDGLNKAIGGQAAAAAATDAGKLQALRAEVENLAERLGNYLIPKIEAAVAWMTRHKTIVEILAGIIAGALVTAMAAYIAKQVIVLANTSILIARTIAVNAQFAIFIARNWAAAGAMDADAASAGRLSVALGAVAARLGAVAAAAGTIAGISSVLLTSGDTTGPAKLPAIKQTLADMANAHHIAGKDLQLYYQAIGYRSGMSREQMATAKLDKTAAINFLLRYGDGSPKVLAALAALGYNVSTGNNADDNQLAMQRQKHAQLVREIDTARSRHAKAAVVDPLQAQLAALEKQILASEQVVKKKHGQTEAQKLALLAAQMRENQRLALEAQAAIFHAHEQALEYALRAAVDAQRRAELLAKEAIARNDLFLSGGALANEGFSFAQVAARQGVTNVTVNVAGHVTTEQALTGLIANNLRVQTRQNVTTSIK